MFGRTANHRHASCLFLFRVLFLCSFFYFSLAEKICIVGSGMGGSSAAFFLRNFSRADHEIHIFEASDKAGGRVAMVELSGDFFEAGASVIHEKNKHLAQFVEILGLERKSALDGTLGLWTGNGFAYMDTTFGESWWARQLADLTNTVRLLLRYGPSSLMTMKAHVQALLDRWMHLYDEGREGYETVESLLAPLDLYNMTQRQLDDILMDEGLNPLLINELVTMVLRINYGQNATISGLAGSVGLAGTGGTLWAVKGGNRQIPEGLAALSRAAFHPSHRVLSVHRSETAGYTLAVSAQGSPGAVLPGKASSEGGMPGEGEAEKATLSNRVSAGDGVSDGEWPNGGKPGADHVEEGREDMQQHHMCDAVILAAPLEAGTLEIVPPVDVPKRSYQHTHATFVRGCLNASYFGLAEGWLPAIIGTIESDAIPFSSIGRQKQYGPADSAYKVFSRQALSDDVLDQLFSWRNATVRIDWAAYPHYKAPEKFAPFLLDDHHLYYVNTFESAASAMETAAVAADNVARLLLKRLELKRAEKEIQGVLSKLEGDRSSERDVHHGQEL